jgi:hypothetical protein
LVSQPGFDVGFDFWFRLPAETKLVKLGFNRLLVSLGINGSHSEIRRNPNGWLGCVV